MHWLGKKTTGQHEGNISIQSGSITVNDNTPTSGEFVIDMASITCTDIKDAEDNKHLIDHLSGEDFFDVKKNPTSLLTIKKFEKASSPNGNYKVTADLTIKGVKNEIQFPAQIEVHGKIVNATVKMVLDRTKWKLEYKSKTIFPTLGDKFIYDDMNFDIKLVLQAN